MSEGWARTKDIQYDVSNCYHSYPFSRPQKWGASYPAAERKEQRKKERKKREGHSHLVIITRPEIDHDMFIPVEEHE